MERISPGFGMNKKKYLKPPPSIHISTWEKDNHLQKWFWMGYVSSQEGTVDVGPKHHELPRTSMIMVSLIETNVLWRNENRTKVGDSNGSRTLLGSIIMSTYYWWKEILHHLGCINLCKQWDKLLDSLNWCKISQDFTNSTNSINECVPGSPPLNGFSEMTIFLVRVYNQQFLEFILFMVFDFHGNHSKNWSLNFFFLILPISVL